MLTGGTQCGLGIMGNSASNVVEEKANCEGLAMLFKEVGKIAAASGWFPTLYLEGECLVFLCSLHVYHFEKEWSGS